MTYLDISDWLNDPTNQNGDMKALVSAIMALKEEAGRIADALEPKEDEVKSRDTYCPECRLWFYRNPVTCPKCMRYVEAVRDKHWYDSESGLPMYTQYELYFGGFHVYTEGKE